MKITNEIIKDLIDAAMSILHHDAGQSDPETIYERQHLKDSFEKILGKAS